MSLLPVADLERALQQYVRPQSFPLAVGFGAAAAELPPHLRRPRRDLGIRVAVCQGFAIARRYGWGLAIGREDLSCPLAHVAFGFSPSLPFYEAGNLCAEMYTRDAAGGARSEAAVPKLPPGADALLLVAPLARAAFTPEVVVFYGNGAQVMRLVAAALYARGGQLTSHHAARVDCAELVIRTRQSGEPQVVVPCYGDRVFGQTGDDEVACAWPHARSEEIVEGLAGTHRGGVRYPVPSFLRYTGEFPEKYGELARRWDTTDPGGAAT
jgi:uncharacterized protein (DUF169 family)